MARERQHDASYETQLGQTREDFQSMVERRQAQLQKIREGGLQPQLLTAPSANPRERLRQLRSIKAAYDSLSSNEPILPSNNDSLLPVLLALRSTSSLVDETKASTASTEIKLLEATKRLDEEDSDLRDTKLIKDGLTGRIEELRKQESERSAKSAREVGKDLVRELQRRKRGYEQETIRLRAALSQFVDDHLAGMLAAEELGGPVIGDMMDVDEGTLEAGFSQHGKRRRRKASATEKAKQRRIDEIWGSRGSDDEDTGEERGEKEAAASEIRTLLRDLFTASEDAGNGNSSGGYINLNRESASVRFLVRAKVAQFHPRDAKRLRLIDFGRDLED